MFDLSALGFGPFFERQLPSSADGIPARIATEHRGAYEVWSRAGAGRAQLAGRLRRERAGPGRPGVGDWVVVRDATEPSRTTVIERVLARRTVFTRGAAGREARAQVVAANVDLVFVVCGLDDDFNVRRIERYLARILASGAEPAVILNKVDRCSDLAARLAELERRCPGIPVHVTSALRSAGTEALRAGIRDGMTVAFVGSSGAGKSTLINALVGQHRMPTGDVRSRDGRGRHTTTCRQLVLLPGGGLLLDTPGMREMRLVNEDGLDAVFGDIATLAGRCRYRDCRHEGEPGCAVQAAVGSGALDAARLEHYRQLEREARAFARRHDARARRRSERVWAQLADEARRLREWKGGKE